MGRVLIAAAVGLVWSVTSAFAAEITGGVGAGPTAPVGEFRDSPTSLGFHGDLSAVVGVGTKGLGFRADAFVGINPYSDVDGGTRTLGATVGAEYAIRIQSPVKPYAMGGFGIFNVHWAEEPRGGRIYDPYSETRVGFAGGAGAAYVLSGFRLFAEARVVIIMTSGGATAFVPLTVGVRFGGKKK